MSKNGKRSSTKEVATHHAGADVSESFGSKPPVIPVGGGRMHTFGFRARNDNGVWPKSDHSVDVKTGYPEGFDKATKGPKA